jgi:hypothetical protein
MTISSTTTRHDYTGDGATVAFACTFKCYDEDHVEVFLADVEQVSGYTVTLNADQDATPGGTVTFLAAPADQVAVRLQRTLPLTQETSLSAYSPFPAKTVERRLDQLAMQAQQLDRDKITEADADLKIAQAAIGEVTGNELEATASGATTARKMKDRFADSVNVLDFGAVADWNGVSGTDNTAAINAAHARLLARGGGTLYFPSGKYLVSGQIKLPTSGVTIAGGEGPYQRQPPIKWRGEGGLRDGFQPSLTTAPFVGSMLVMTYNGAAPAVAKIETYGAGHFTVEGLTFWDPSGGTLPFILTTNTNVTIRDNGFFGSKSGVLADQDVLIIGGQDTNPATVNDPNMAFHGFTSEVANNFFGRVRRGILAQQWVASLYVHGNFFSHTTGTNLANGAPIEFAPGVTGSTGFSQIVNNRFNMAGGYAYGVKLGKTTNCFIAGNDVEDAQHANNVAVAYFDADSSGNMLLVNARPAAVEYAAVDDNGNNLIIDSTPNAGSKSVFPYGVQEFREVQAWTTVGPVLARAFGTATDVATYASQGFRLRGSYWTGSAGANDDWKISQALSTGANGATTLNLNHEAGSTGTAIVRILNGAVNADAGANKLSPQLQLLAKYWNGSASANDTWSFQVVPGSGTNPTATLKVIHSGTSGALEFELPAATPVRFGSGGPVVRTGAGSPEAAISAPVGSLYLRTDGGAGTTLYVKESGTGNTGWVAK